MKADTPSALRAELLRLKQLTHDSGWELACVITRICNAEAWREFTDADGQRFASREAWIRCDLVGIYGPAAVSRICKTVNKIQKLDEQQRKPYLAAHFWTVCEALEAETEDQALELVQSGKTQHEVRSHVKARRERPDGLDATQDDEFLYLGLPQNMPAAIVGQWEAVCNLARFRLEQPTPSLITIFEHVLADYMQNWPREVDPCTLSHATSDGVTLVWTMADVARGDVKCRMCGSHDKTTLDPHHIIERSYKCKGCGTDHDIPIVVLCRRCHNSIKDGANGDWAVWAARWGYGDLAKEHGGRFDENEVVGG